MKKKHTVFKNHCFRIFISASDIDDKKLKIITSKKYIKKAVHRNLMKRRIRAIMNFKEFCIDKYIFTCLIFKEEKMFLPYINHVRSSVLNNLSKLKLLKN